MKIISRYVLREHVGPLAFAFTALTSLMLLNFISRQFGDLVGKGLPWPVIGEFFLLSIPFTVALTVPMSVLVAVLYAYSRLASENEVTALKASGVSPLRLVTPTIAAGVVMSIGLLAFNDQVLPRANHRLKTLQDDISQTKPTLLLHDQVINAIVEGKLYLRAGTIDRSDGRMREVVIYDLADPARRRTIYAQSGQIAFAANRVDLDLNLFSGQMQEVSTDKPSQLNRLFYKHDRIRVRDVGRDLKLTTPNASSKGDREMNICEMQLQLWRGNTQYAAAQKEFAAAQKAPRTNEQPVTAYMPPMHTPEPHGIGWAYCGLLRAAFGVKDAHAADLTGAHLHAAGAPQDTTRRAPAQDTTKKTVVVDSQRKPATPQVSPTPFPAGQPVTVLGGGAAAAASAAGQSAEEVAARAAAELIRSAKLQRSEVVQAKAARTIEAQLRLDMAERNRNRYDIEIHKKFSLAAACLIFCIVAPPIALRSPRGGVGLVIGVSLAVFALYYVGLIGGEALANKGLLPPFWAMWGTNVIMTLIGIVMLFRMGHETGSGRGGGLREWLDNRRARKEDRLARQGAAR